MMADENPALTKAFAGLSPADLRQIRTVALASDDHMTANAAHTALLAADTVQRPEHATCGKLIPHSYRDDAGRKITTFTGDFMAAFEPFMRPGASGRYNLALREEALSGKLTSVRVPAGHKIEIVKA